MRSKELAAIGVAAVVAACGTPTAPGPNQLTGYLLNVTPACAARTETLPITMRAGRTDGEWHEFRRPEPVERTPGLIVRLRDGGGGSVEGTVLGSFSTVEPSSRHLVFGWPFSFSEDAQLLTIQGAVGSVGATITATVNGEISWHSAGAWTTCVANGHRLHFEPLFVEFR
jgi:hypothetical protein